MGSHALYIGIDIGAGMGAKIALFDESRKRLAETVLLRQAYGNTADSLADSLGECIQQFLQAESTRIENVRAIGIAAAGLLHSNGDYLLAANLPHLNGCNLPALLRNRLDVPIGIENDANAGGLAEWSVLQTEIIYWVFGGGWGGAWISADGEVRHPAIDWNGDDSTLHHSNEPGYSVALDKINLKMLFYQKGVSFERFEQILCDELQPAAGKMTGPAGSPDLLRAETILSGPGRCRLFRTVVGSDDSYIRFLELTEAKEINDPAIAGKHISKLSNLRVEAAIVTDRLFGRVLAEATRIILKEAEADGCRPGVPICIGGKPRYALPYFGPSAQRALGAMGYMNYLRPSIIDEHGSNANLVGACVVAQKAFAAES